MQPIGGSPARSPRHGRSRAFERHVRGVRFPAQVKEILCREMRRRAGTGRGESGLAFLHRALQLLERARGKGRVHEHDVRLLRNDGEREQILRRVVARIAEERGIHRVRRRMGKERVAVRCGLRHLGRRDVAARADLVLHDHRLAERLAHLRRHEPRDDVYRPAGREGDQHVDRLRRISLPIRDRGDQGRANSCQCSHHRSPPQDDTAIGAIASMSVTTSISAGRPAASASRSAPAKSAARSTRSPSAPISFATRAKSTMR